MKALITTLVLCTAMAAGIIFFLFRQAQTPLTSGGFQRHLATRLFLSSRQLDLGVNSYYLCDAVSGGVYLGNYSVENLVVFADSGLQDTTRLYYSFKDHESFSTALLTSIDSPHVYFHDGLTPALAYGTLDQAVLQRYERARPSFNLALPLSRDDYVIRTPDTVAAGPVLVKLHRGVESVRYPLPYPGDGIFAPDGMLVYSSYLQRIVYTYYYRNLFICFDSALCVRYVAHTVDTTTHVRVRIHSEDAVTKTLAPTSHLVNRHSCVDGGYLYIHSELKADNEDPALFSSSSVVDVYALADGRYRYSFYVQDFRSQKIHGMVKCGASLYVLYDHHLIRYMLDAVYEERLRSSGSLGSSGRE